MTFIEKGLCSTEGTISMSSSFHSVGVKSGPSAYVKKEETVPFLSGAFMRVTNLPKVNFSNVETEPLRKEAA